MKIPLIANLEIDTARAVSGRDRLRILRTPGRTTVQALCATAGIPYGVTGGNQSKVVMWGGPVHAFTVTDDGDRILAVAQMGLPLEKSERALRVLEILAYGFFDYAARESLIGKGYLISPQPKQVPS